MSVKTFKNFFTSLLKRASKEQPAPQTESPEQGMFEWLQCLHNLLDADYISSNEVCQAFGVQEMRGQIDDIRKILEYHILFREQDMSRLYQYIVLYLQAIHEAVRNDRKETTKWTWHFLNVAVRELCVPIQGVDAVYTDQLLEERVKYAEKMYQLVEKYQKYDDTANELIKLYTHRLRLRDEHKAKKNAYRNKLESGEIDEEIAEIKLYGNDPDPSKLSDAAKLVVNELEEIHRLSSEIADDDAAIASAERQLRGILAHIGSLHKHLTEKPRVSDPTLQAEIEKAGEEYGEALQSWLDASAEKLQWCGAAALDKHLRHVQMQKRWSFDLPVSVMVNKKEQHVPDALKDSQSAFLDI